MEIAGLGVLGIKPDKGGLRGIKKDKEGLSNKCPKIT
jgi:hypothetical protein